MRPYCLEMLVFSLLLSGCSFFKSKETLSEEVIYDCKSAREYITVLAFLRSEKFLKLADSQAQDIAMNVTAGCTGAAERFIMVTKLLRKAGLDSKSAIDLSSKLAIGKDSAADTFVLIFKRAFAKESLDLDIATSIRLARSMSLDFKGDPEQAGQDYEGIASYCIDRKKLNLGKPTCGELARRIVQAGEVQSEEVADSFIDAFEYLTESDGPNLSTADAIKVAEELVTVSKYAPENFGKAYKFAVADNGLRLGRAPAVEFAKKVAKFTKYEKVAKLEKPTDVK